MAKKQAKSNIPIVVKPVPPNYFDKAERFAPPLEEARIRRMDGKDVPVELSAFGEGCDGELVSLLSIPESVFRMDDGPSRYYSNDEKFAFGSALSKLAAGRLDLPPDAYGISLSGPPSTVYFLLVDMRRRIIVREPIICMHEEVPKKGWDNVRARIKSALELANTESSRKGGIVAFFDGYLRSVKMA